MEILRQTFLQWLFKCTLFPDWIRMWNVGFSTGRRTLWERVRTNNKLNPHVTPTLGIKPGAKVEGGEHSLPRSLFTLLYLLETTFSSSCHLLICSIITVCDINFMFDTVWNLMRLSLHPLLLGYSTPILLIPLPFPFDLCIKSALLKFEKVCNQKYYIFSRY